MWKVVKLGGQNTYECSMCRIDLQDRCGTRHGLEAICNEVVSGFHISCNFPNGYKHSYNSMPGDRILLFPMDISHYGNKLLSNIAEATPLTANIMYIKPYTFPKIPHKYITVLAFPIAGKVQTIFKLPTNTRREN